MKATLQGVFKKEGKIFKMYSFDNTTDNDNIMVVTGIADFVEQTIKFKVATIEEWNRWKDKKTPETPQLLAFNAQAYNLMTRELLNVVTIL